MAIDDISVSGEAKKSRLCLLEKEKDTLQILHEI